MTVELAETRTWPGLDGQFASLPWYDLPEIRDANDAFWRALAASLRVRGVADVPTDLERTLPYGVDWNGACLFTQICGYPIFTTAREHFCILGTPCYDAPGCSGTLHRSFIVVHRRSPFGRLEDLRGTVFAVNEADSNSGMNLPRRSFAPLHRNGRFFEHTVVTGSHARSVEFVASEKADAAAIDCVSFALLRRCRSDAIGELRIIGETPASPAPPFATSNRRSVAEVNALRLALRDVLQDQRNKEILNPLLLSGVAFTSETDYAVVMTYENQAVSLGYPVLA